MRLLPILALLLLTGCSLRYEMAKESAIEGASEAQDRALVAAEFVICRGASIGAIQRRYGARPDVWKALCLQKGAVFIPSYLEGQAATE